MRIALAIVSGFLAVLFASNVGAQETQSAAPGSAIPANVMAAKLIHNVTPAYPKIAKKAHVSGTVVLHVIVGADGKVQEVSVISGPSLLTQAAVDAVEQWQYEPTLLNGVPVNVRTTVSVVFELDGHAAPTLTADVSEQISLKDGTKINGKIISVDGDTFHIQTSSSEISVPRSQIVSITFGADDQAAKVASVVNIVRQSIVSGTYTNDTAHFTLTVPADWKTDDEWAKKTAGAVGALSATDPYEKILIRTMPSGAPAKETAQLIASAAKTTLQGFQESAEAPVRIDNRDAYTFTFSALIPLGNLRTQEGTDEPADTTVKALVKYLVAVVPMEDRTVMITCGASDTMFDQVDPLFHQIVMSFHGTAVGGSASTTKP